MPLSTDDLPQPWRRILPLADRDPRRAARLAHSAQARAPADDPLALAWAAFGAGWTLLRWERLAAARQALQDAHDRFAALVLSLPQLHCRYGLLLVALAHGGGEALQGEWQALADEYLAAGQAHTGLRVRIQQAAHLNVLGRPRAALDTVAALTALGGALGSADQARLLRIAAIAHGIGGDLERADQQLEQAADLFATLRWPVEVAKCRLERAWLRQRREQYEAALAELRPALRCFRRFDLPLQTAFCERNLGLVASRLGRYDWAIAETMRAKTRFAELGRADHAANCDMTLGAVAYYGGMFDLSLLAYRRAQLHYRELGSERLVLLSQRNQALALRAQGRPAAALALLDAISAPMRALGDQLESAEILLAQAQALADLDQLDQAIERCGQARAQFAALGDQPGAAKCLLQQGWLHLDRRDLSAASACLAEAEAGLSDRPMHLWRATYALGRCSELAGDHQAALDRYQTASRIVITLRRQLASEHASSAIFSQAQQLYADVLRLAADQGDAALVLQLAEQQRALALQRQVLQSRQQLPPALQEQLEAHQAGVRALLASHAPAEAIDAAVLAYTELVLHARHLEPIDAGIQDDALDLPRLAELLDSAYPAGWTVLTYTQSSGELLIAAYDRGGSTLARTPADARLRELLEQATLPAYRYFTFLDLQRLRDSTRAPWAALSELALRLIPPAVSERFAANHRLLIIPDGMLHALPWAALRLNGRWLCEQTVVQLLPSLALWPALRERPAGGTAALLVGCSQFHGRAADLPHVPEELECVATRWPGRVTRVEDAAATRAALLAMAGRYGLVHLASHAQLVSRHGMLAHVKLWDADLLLDDLARLAIGGGLVTLTTCDGASSDVLPGEELLGLSRALLAGGARDVVASLWPVHDGATQQLLGLLYDHLARGADPAAALALAQRALIDAGRASDEPQWSPLVWAHFCAIGAGSALFGAAA